MPPTCWTERAVAFAEPAKTITEREPLDDCHPLPALLVSDASGVSRRSAARQSAPPCTCSCRSRRCCSRRQRTARQALCDLHLPDAARAQEAEAPRRTPVAPLPGRPPQDGLSDRQHRLVLPDGPLVRLVRKAQETRPLVLRGLRDRDPRPPADDLFDQLRRDGSRRPL